MCFRARVAFSLPALACCAALVCVRPIEAADGFAIPVSTPFPDDHLASSPPAGFVSFCIRFADQCREQPGAPTVVALTRERWRKLNQVNAAVNQAIWPEDDLTHYGRAEYWTIPADGYGDCDDYAVTKRAKLLALGFPEPALRLAVANTPRNGRHAVLMVATDHGDFVLDNLRADIVAWNETGYTWVERQSAANPLAWTLPPSSGDRYVADAQPDVASPLGSITR